MRDQDKTKAQLISELEELRGRISGFISVVSDITQRKLAEQSLHASEERFRKVFEEGPLGVALVTLDSRIQHVNRRFCEMLGYSEEEIIALGITGITHPEDCHLEDRSRIRLLRGEVPSFTIDKRFVRKDRQVIWGQLTASLMHDAEGRPMALIGMVEDITDRKRAEEALKEAHDELERRIEERTAELKKANEQLAVFHKFTESSSQGFGMVDLDGRIAYANPTMCRLFGEADPANVIGNPIGQYYQEGVKERRTNEMLPALERDGIWAGELPMLSRQGTLVPTLHHAFLLRDAEGRPFRRCVVVTDITEIKRAQEALAKSENRFRAFVTASSDVIYCMSPDWSEMRYLWGRDFIPDTEEPSSTWLDSYIHPDDQTHVLAVVNEAIRTKTVFALEHQVRRLDGSLGWTFSRAVPLLDESGEIVEWFGAASDITERKQTEENLAIFRRFAEAAGQGFGMSDLDGRITYMNPVMARLVGEKRPEDALGKQFSTYHTSDFVTKLDEVIRPALRRDGYWQGELKLVSRDGAAISTLHNIFPVLSTTGDVHRFAAVVTDISELKQTQQMLRQTCEELRASQERFELVVRGSGVGIWDWDIRTGKVYYSPRWKALFGYGEDEIGDSFEEWVRLLHPDERDRIIRFQEDFLASTEPTIAAEYRLRHKDGSYRWIVGHAIVVRDEQGRACRLVGSHGDITDRKLAEEKVQAEQRALRRMVMAGDHERRLITYELHDGAAQQLAAATMLLERRQPPIGREPKETEDAYQKGLDALRQANLEVRRVMSWLRTPVLDRFGVVAAIGDVAGQLESMRGGPKIEYEHAVTFKRLEPTLENSLFRIAQEGMTNACRHSKSERVRVALTQNSDEVTLEVRDWGTGFDQETVQATRFGLEGIRERCRILGGRVSISSRPDQGTVIEATFPVIEATSEE
jgi:PAS domain S-box-containing protein